MQNRDISQIIMKITSIHPWLMIANLIIVSFDKMFSKQKTNKNILQTIKIDSENNNIHHLNMN